MTHDAVVIGAGPAGAIAARELARRGCAVFLVDKAQFPRPKVCGCCLNGSAVATLRQLGLAHVLAAGVPLRDVRIGAGRRAATVTLPGGVALSREALDVALVREAERAGVCVREGVVAKFDRTPAETGSGLRFRGNGLQTGEACRRVFVGGLSCVATGLETVATESQTAAVNDSVAAKCVTARVVLVASGLAGGDATPDPRSRIGAGVSVPAEAAPAFFTPGTIFMATGRGGYVGLVRVEDGRLDVAAAFDVAFVKSQGGLGPAAETVLGEVGWPCVPGLAELPWKGTPALTRHAKQLAGERWFAIGDAAGYVEPFTGEGMAWAVASAAAVAPIAARGVQQWDASLTREWEIAHRRIIGARQQACRVVSRVLRSPTLTTVAVRALSVLPFLSGPVVRRLNRPALLRPHGTTA